MKYLNFLTLAFTLLLITSCGKKHNHSSDTEFEYHAHIHAPNTENKKMGQNMPIKVVFESHTGETVHHINVKMYKKDDSSVVIFNEPSEAHVHETSGKYTFEKTLNLSADNGIEAHTNYILEASVWGHDGMEGLEKSKVEFHVHPM